MGRASNLVRMFKHIAIIGGTSGIGRATVDLLKSKGYILHIACRSPEKLADLGISSQAFDAAAPGSLVWPEKFSGKFIRSRRRVAISTPRAQGFW